ncbi:hypothetical protein CTI12_AA355700 [Artemisia annua]|uniref:Uncharacterized protein n=1 Tax=Artemisia annua TaxID=35608 RepID=A0A2U1MPU8_ARTAN|nr:hypothetical protein CTI12_AA355700 [Artemisia annua]
MDGKNPATFRPKKSTPFGSKGYLRVAAIRSAFEQHRHEQRLEHITISEIEGCQLPSSASKHHENILVKSYGRCEVKVIDLGSSCFETNHLCSYVQSRFFFQNDSPALCLPGVIGIPQDKGVEGWAVFAMTYFSLTINKCLSVYQKQRVRMG